MILLIADISGAHSIQANAFSGVSGLHLRYIWVLEKIRAIFGMQAVPKEEEMVAIAEKWRPYRSLGSFYMWRVSTPRSTLTKRSKSAPAGVPL